MKPTKPETDIIEEDFGSTDITPRELILRHFDRLSQFIFKGETQPTTSETQKGLIQQPDRREVFCQAIDFAIGILKPFYDKEMKTSQADFDTAKLEAEEELISDSIKSESYQRSKDPNYKKSTYEDWIKFFNTQKIIPISKFSGYYECYTSRKYSAYLELFEQLNFLLFRKNYLASETFGGA